MSARRTVQLCKKVPRERGSKARLWAFGLADLAELLGTTETALAARLRRGTADFNPEDLETICRAWALRNRAELAAEALRALESR